MSREGARPFDVVVIAGVSGCGKSTVAHALAEATGYTYLEGDDYHTPDAISKMASGHPLDDTDRWPWLQRLHDAAHQQVTAGRRVIMTCSALKESYRQLLQGQPEPNMQPTLSVAFVLLDPPLAQLQRRLTARHHFMPASLLQSQLTTLERGPSAPHCESADKPASNGIGPESGKAVNNAMGFGGDESARNGIGVESGRATSDNDAHSPWLCQITEHCCTTHHHRFGAQGPDEQGVVTRGLDNLGDNPRSSGPATGTHEPDGVIPSDQHQQHHDGIPDTSNEVRFPSTKEIVTHVVQVLQQHGA